MTLLYCLLPRRSAGTKASNINLSWAMLITGTMSDTNNYIHSILTTVVENKLCVGYPNKTHYSVLCVGYPNKTHYSVLCVG